MYKIIVQSIGFILMIACMICVDVQPIYATNTNPFFYQVDDYKDDTTDLGQVFSQQGVVGQNPNESDTLLKKLYEVFGLTGPAYEGDDKASAYIKLVINLFLGLASFVALLIVIFGFYQMFFSEQEAGYDKAKKMVIGASIALLIMGLSRFIVTYIFSVYEATSQTGPSAGF